MKTVYQCEGCARVFPSAAIIEICERRHVARKAAYAKMIEEASKILPKPSYESWPPNPGHGLVPRGVEICTTRTGRAYFWWKARNPEEGSMLGVGGADVTDASIDAPSLDAAWDQWIALSIEEDAPFKMGDGSMLHLERRY